MRKKLNVSCFALLAAAVPAFAQFEGVMEMKMSMTDKDGTSLGGGTMTVAVAKAGIRSEMNMPSGPIRMKMVILQKTSAPDKLYRINEANRTYSEIDLAKMREMAGQRQPEQISYTVEKLGEEKILDYKTQHVRVKQKSATGEAGPVLELWTAKDFLDYETYSKLNARQAKMAGQEGLIKALKEAEADGMPLKSVADTEDGSKITTEMVKAEKKTLPASTFEIPEGYSKAEGGMMDMMGGMSGPQADEAKKKMDEALKNMTPEQREQIEKMMKPRQGTNP